MNDRWLVTAFLPGARNARASAETDQAAGDRTPTNIHPMMLSKLEAQRGGLSRRDSRCILPTQLAWLRQQEVKAQKGFWLNRA